MKSIDNLTFVAGAGHPEDHTACIMSAARILAGEATKADMRGDTCANVCPVIRRFAIGVNDWRGWRGTAERTRFLRPLTPMLLDTVGPHEMQQKRAFIAADFACRYVIPLMLDLCRKKKLAEGIRALPEITDRETALLVHARVRDAAAAVDAAADAAAYAADAAAYAADADIYAAADADAAYASAAAYAAYAAYAADAAATRIQIRDGLVSTLKKMCEVQ